MIDFQLMKFTNPACDLGYFLGSSTSPELRREHLDELLHFYHSRLIKNLKNLGHSEDIYPFETLMTDCKERFILLLMMGVLHAQVTKLCTC